MGPSHDGLIVSQLQIMSELVLAFSQFIRDLLVVFNRFLDLDELLLMLSLLQFLVLVKEVLLSESNILSQHI